MGKEVQKEETKQTQINLRIKDGEQFYSNETSINFNPNEFIFDFKCLTNVHDITNHRAIVLKHNAVIVNPFHAKSFLIMLNRAIKDYESKFGEIKKSEAMKKAEKLASKGQKEIEVPKPIVDSNVKNYFG